MEMNSAYETVEINELHRDHSEAGASAIENSNINYYETTSVNPEDPESLAVIGTVIYSNIPR